LYFCRQRHYQSTMEHYGRRAAVDHDACGVGFITQLGSETGSHEIIERALEALRRLEHRGGIDADERSGDGAGLLTSLPRYLFNKWAKDSGVTLPDVFAVGMAFLPRTYESAARRAIQSTIARLGATVLGWRSVPTVPAALGPRALETLPAIEQFFVAGPADGPDFESLLFRIRKVAEAEAPTGTYFCSLSSRTIVYKGLLTPEQLPIFYPDLQSSDFASSFAVFHQRYSTNTRPSWSLAQPFRFVGHNGEINTVRGNRRWLLGRTARYLQNLGLPDHVALLEREVSDSASFDNGLEMLLRCGYNLPAAIMSMVPPAWENADDLPAELKEFLEANAWRQESWDGPAGLVFADGEFVGAKLDRNGLRPLRYTLTDDGLLTLGSEVGIANLSGKNVVERQRLGPGEMLLVNPATGDFLRPQDVWSKTRWPITSSKRPARIVASRMVAAAPTHWSKRALSALGWTDDQFRLLFQPLVRQGKEAVWSMGDDAAPAFLSSQCRPLWDYCKQKFAQVTNPPIDPLREAHVMSLETYCGSAVLSSPLIDGMQVEQLSEICGPVRTIDLTFEAAGGVESGMEALARVGREAASAVAEGAGVVLLSDRSVSDDRVALPALLAAATAWNSLVEKSAWRLPLIVESGQVFDTHHIALLVAVGVTAVHPFMAWDMAAEMSPQGPSNYLSGIEGGLRKVIARMGISTIASYRNSQLFETLGLDDAVCAEFFPDADCVLGGKNLSGLLNDAIERHNAAFRDTCNQLRDAGLYRFRKQGEHHSNSPDVVRVLHQYIKSPTAENFRAFETLQLKRNDVAIRDLLDLVPGSPIPLSSVESESAILTRFSTQAMSLGAISPEAHRTLAIAMNRIGARSNTGEGGEDACLFREQPEAVNRVKQVASARFGVTADYLISADELEIKIAQGSKPGEGGQLPASKVSAYIATLRHAVPNMTLISPPPHHDVYSIEDLAQLIYDLRAINPTARIGVKLVATSGVGVIAVGVAKAGADVITISGHDGGTGASPLSSIKNTGLPWEVGLREAHLSLLNTGLRHGVRLRVDGGLKFSRDIIVAALLGADEFGFGTAALLAMGCVMARQCHLNTCPVGIASQDEKFRVRFSGKPEMIVDYFRGLAAETRQSLAAMGANSIATIVGAVGRLRPLSPNDAPIVEQLLCRVPQSETRPLRPRDSAASSRTTSQTGQKLRQPSPRISNSDRSIGAHISGDLLRRTRSFGVPAVPAEFDFMGTAGQSFGAFLAAGLTFRLRGEANDYVGKGLSGGTISISAGEQASARGDVLAGNAVLYGATRGQLFLAGRAGERFAVRNSGALAVVEGVGQHGCEYMTAGVVIVLGPVGKNFGAGMTGGLAYCLASSMDVHYNREFVSFQQIGADEQEWLRYVLHRHMRLTGSPIAARILRGETQLALRVQPHQLPCSVTDTWARAAGVAGPREVALRLPVEDYKRDSAGL
jgi:glutamate synthase (NADPH/NADH) large chain/glutamate synthase (ferredoxin)